MAKRIRTYLSGGMECAKNEGADWRGMMEAWISDELGHSVFNPNIQSENYLRNNLPRENLRKLKYRDLNRFQSIVRGIVRLDSREIAQRSDYVICFWDASAMRGAGTKGEITIARLFNKPVYLVTRIRQSSIPGWVLGCTSRIFRSFDDLKPYLKRRYSVKNTSSNRK